MRGFVDDTSLQDIADAIREKTGEETEYKPSEMGDAIRGIETGGGGDISKFGIINEVTGTGIVTLDYVNENEHNVEVKLSSDTVTDFSGVEVKCVGKNLFDESKLSNGEFVEFNGIRCYKYRDSSLGISYDGIFDLNSQHTIAIRIYRDNENATKHTNFSVEYTDGSKSNIKCIPNETTIFTSPINKSIKRIKSSASYSDTAYLDLSIMQIEISPVKTDYEPYTEKTYTANADGTVDGVTSISPTMNIICDGVDISAKYYCCPSVEYDGFWDKYQNYGTRSVYDSAFYGEGWTDETMKIKYPITLTSGKNMFQSNSAKDLRPIMAMIDFSTANNLSSIFQQCLAETIGSFSVKNAAFTYAFYYCRQVREIDCIKDVNINHSFTNGTFQYCNNLEKLGIEGVIGQSINFQWSSLLEVESAKSILRCLANYKDTNNAYLYSITFHTNVWELLNAEGKASPNGNSWEDYLLDIGWTKG